MTFQRKTAQLGLKKQSLTDYPSNQNSLKPGLNISAKRVILAFLKTQVSFPSSKTGGVVRGGWEGI